MEMLQSFVVYSVWVFFAVWGTALAALTVIAFKPDILAWADQINGHSDRR